MNLLTLVARLHLAWLALADPPLPVSSDRRPARRGRGDHGQATTEYALVLLAAALVALLVIAWATAGGGAAKIGRLFDRVIDAVIDKV
jgi:hypothetical protein